MEIGTKGNGIGMCRTAQEPTIIRMGIFTRGSGMMENSMEKVCTFMFQTQYTKDTG